MTSVSPPGRSPHSPNDMGSDQEHWDFLNHSSGASSVVLMPSPSSGSLSGFVVVEQLPHATSHRSLESPPAPNMSPVFLDMDAAVAIPPATSSPFHSAPLYADQASMVAFASTAGPMDAGFVMDAGGEQFMTPPLLFTDGFAGVGRAEASALTMPADMTFMDPFPQSISYQGLGLFGTPSPPALHHPSPPMPHHQNPGSFHPPQESPSPMAAHLDDHRMSFGNFQLYQPSPDSRQWTPEVAVPTPPPHAPSPGSSQPQQQSPIFIQESGYSTSPLLTSSCGSPYNSDSASSDVKPFSGIPSPEASLRKVKSGKVEKKGGSRSSSSSNDNFVVMTPTRIAASAGRNMFDCFEAIRPSQRGRKGPLANDTKESALQVRRRGACFCCHSRKVRCDMERPCKNCQKLAAHVPQIICWQFQDFMNVLFPAFMRSHFKKEQMASFMRENLEDIQMHQTLTIELYSGPSFASVLRLPARAFRPKTERVMKHYHLFSVREKVNMQECKSAPLVLELDTIAQKDALKKAAKEYVLAMTREPCYVSQTTDSIKHTDVPRRVLKIVQQYADRTDSAMVKKALAIYSAHYVMTRHLCLTHESTINLRRANVIPPNVTVMTPRVAARQIKAVVDEMLARDMQSLFESFSKSLKPKSKRDWAPCLAAFLVLCLFIEAVETAADNFVITCNEISMRERRPLEFKRESAHDVKREVENLPFKQFAYQFHQIYQTHIRDGSAKPYNPLVDDSQLDFDGAVNPAAALEMTHQLRDMIRDGKNWSELDSLSSDPILPDGREAHPFPRDVSLTYTGRLISRFLLSFRNEKYIFEGGQAFT